MPINRQPAIAGTPALPPHGPRTVSAQAMMNGLTQPNNLTQPHPGGIQNPMHQNAFQSVLPLNHQPTQMGSSPLPGSHPQTHTPTTLPASISATGPMSSQGVNRSLTTPDNAMFLPFQGNSMHPSMTHNPQRVAGATPSFPFMPSQTPPNAPNDFSQNLNSGPLTASGSRTSTGMMFTPAQVAEQMNKDSEGFSTPFNSSPAQGTAPPRPPSHNAPHANFPMPPHPQIHHQSPRQSDPLAGHPAQAQRPQSQQSHQRQSPQQPGQPRTPHAPPGPLPMNPGAHPGRIPMPGPPVMPPQARPPSSSAGPPPNMQMTPRPPPGSVAVAAPPPSNAVAPMQPIPPDNMLVATGAPVVSAQGRAL